jgi:hypothetical protein
MLMLSEGLAYIDRGFRLFLVGSDGRTPLVEQGWFERGVHDATGDPEDFQRTRAARPPACSRSTWT